MLVLKVVALKVVVVQVDLLWWMSLNRLICCDLCIGGWEMTMKTRSSYQKLMGSISRLVWLLSMAVSIDMKW